MVKNAPFLGKEVIFQGSAKAGILFWFSCFYSHLNPKLELCTRKGEQKLPLSRVPSLFHNLQILGARWICENNPRKHSHCLSGFLERLPNGSERHRSQMGLPGKSNLMKSLGSSTDIWEGKIKNPKSWYFNFISNLQTWILASLP